MPTTRKKASQPSGSSASDRQLGVARRGRPRRDTSVSNTVPSPREAQPKTRSCSVVLSTKDGATGRRNRTDQRKNDDELESDEENSRIPQLQIPDFRNRPKRRNRLRHSGTGETMLDEPTIHCETAQPHIPDSPRSLSRWARPTTPVSLRSRRYRSLGGQRLRVFHTNLPRETQPRVADRLRQI